MKRIPKSKLKLMAEAAVDAFDGAAQDFAFMGAQPRREWDVIEQRYNTERAKLVQLIVDLAAGKQDHPRGADK